MARGLAGAGALLLLTPLLLAIWVLGSATGLRAALSAFDRVAPGQVSVGVVEGRLIDGLRLRDLRLHLPGARLSIGDLQLRWSPRRLLRGQLLIRSLSARDVAWRGRLAPRDGRRARPPRLTAPIRVELEQVQIERARLDAIDGSAHRSIAIERVSLRATWRDTELRLPAFELILPRLALSARGSIQSRDACPLRLDLDWMLGATATPWLVAQGRLTGDLDALHLDQRLAGIVAGRLDAHLRAWPTQPRWDARLDITRFDPARLIPTAPPIDLDARLHAQGDSSQILIAGHLGGAPAASAAPFDGAIDLSWRAGRLHLEKLRFSAPATDTWLAASGHLDFGAPDGQVRLNGAWRHLRWPPGAEPWFETPAGALEFQGRLDGFRYNLSATLRGPALSDIAIQARGSGDRAGVRLDDLALNALDGQLTGKGQVRWSPAPAWDLALSGSHLNLAPLEPRLAGQLGLKAETKGGLDTGFDYQIKADLALDAYPAAVAHLAGDGTRDALQARSISIETLGGRLDGHATLDWSATPRWNARLTLADLDSGRHDPRWPGRLSGRLGAQGELIADGALTVDIDEFGGTLRGVPFQLAAHLARAAAGDLSLTALTARSDSAALHASGSLENPFALEFQLSAPNPGERLPGLQGALTASGRLHGSPARPRLDARIEAGALRHGARYLERPRASIELQRGGREAKHAAWTGRLTLHADALHISPPGARIADIALEARSRAEGDIELRGGGRAGAGTLRLTGSARAAPSGWRLDYRLLGEQLEIGTSEDCNAIVAADLDGEIRRASARLRGVLRIPHAQLSAGCQTDRDRTGAPPPTAPGFAPPLGIDLRVDLGDGVWLDAAGLRGRLGGTLRLGREPERDPRATGRLQVFDGRYRIAGTAAMPIRPLASMRLDRGELAFDAAPLDNPRIDLRGRYATGAGDLGVRVTGSLRAPTLALAPAKDQDQIQAEVARALLKRAARATRPDTETATSPNPTADPPPDIEAQPPATTEQHRDGSHIRAD